MNFRFNNYARDVGRHGKYVWFEWRIFMEEPPEVLSKVERVEYRLHETFPNPIQTVENRETQFALEAEGWGSFDVFITVCLDDGKEEHLKYYLNLDRASFSSAHRPGLLPEVYPAGFRAA